MEKNKKLFKNTLLLILGNFASKILVFLLVPFYTSILSTEEYAISDLLVTTVNLAYPLLTLMISTSVLRFCLDKDSDRKQIFSIGFYLEIIGSVILSILAFLFADYFDFGEYKLYFIAYFVSYSIQTLVLQYAKGKEYVAVYSIGSVCNTISLISCNLLFLLKCGLGIKGYLLSMIIANVSAAIIVFTLSKAYRDFLSIKKIDLKILKKMVLYSLPLIPNSISWWISNSSDRYILGYFTNLNELGTYSVAYKIPSILITISGIMISAWELSAVDEFGSEENRVFYSKVYNSYYHISLIGCAILIILVKPLATILFNNDFYTAWRYVPLLAFSSVFNILSGFIGTIFTSAKKTKSIFITTMIGAFSNILLNFALIPFIGAFGAAIATVVSYIVTFVIRLKASEKIMKLSYDMKSSIISLFMLGIMVGLCTADNPIFYFVGAIILFKERDYISIILKNMYNKIVRKGVKKI